MVWITSKVNGQVMLTREEIEQSLQPVPVETVAAIALRAALRVLPLFA